MQPHSNIFLATCTSRQVLHLIADQWTALVMYALEDKDSTKRFSQLLTQIDGISKKMLSQTLRDMERNGLVQRVVYPAVPPHVEYSLTPLGQTLIEPITALRKWAEEHLDEVKEARIKHNQTEHISIQEQVASLVQQREQH
ncbi:winged helix-turn-helix transcriptional regulator [Ktedonobacter racemifer]|uniref:Transcriptional regulator, HxlR family n=1 Tax=Ktedonobacter racemifer DSM 44963 TaxID=485913 RepID=D6U2R4_KTERA|nr:helix-turn-helix domain-containing protein [Ktedonobacter racemifer]EFH81028.1 transcriptional regulator, HxlR family [Ktedonobacter racemifer DSM 44963]